MAEGEKFGDAGLSLGNLRFRGEKGIFGGYGTRREGGFSKPPGFNFVRGAKCPDAEDFFFRSEDKARQRLAKWGKIVPAKLDALREDSSFEEYLKPKAWRPSSL
jgi:hypothetical protein